MKPEFITFTGLDTQTDIDRVIDISSRYRVEWGVLFSPKRQGTDNRYPDLAAFSPSLIRLRTAGLMLAAHLCGGHSEAIMADRDPDVDVLRFFQRAQVNSAAPDPEAIQAFGIRHEIKPITQSRELTFPDYDGIAWLYDCSGGKGDAPSAWPTHPGRLVGYAGGLNPDNVNDMLAQMDTSGAFWIDMESGVRTDDWLDLDKCEAVCKAVYD